jgi:hypothetical protein
MIPRGGLSLIGPWIIIIKAYAKKVYFFAFLMGRSYEKMGILVKGYMQK